jgi:hypothetical protein
MESGPTMLLGGGGFHKYSILLFQSLLQSCDGTANSAISRCDTLTMESLMRLHQTYWGVVHFKRMLQN